MVLVVCLFLPAVDGCGSPIYLGSTVLGWPPPLLGLVGCVVALVGTRSLGGLVRERRIAVAVVIAAAVSCGWLSIFLGSGTLVGLALADTAAAWLMIGAIVWRYEAACEARGARAIGTSLMPVLAGIMFVTYALVVGLVPSHGAPPLDLRPVFWSGC